MLKDSWSLEERTKREPMQRRTRVPRSCQGSEGVLLHRSRLPMVSSKGTLVCSEVSSGTERDLFGEGGYSNHARLQFTAGFSGGDRWLNY